PQESTAAESGSAQPAGRPDAEAGSSADEGRGQAQRGTQTSQGTPGDGNEGLDFSGKDMFNRRVIFRPDIKRIVKVNGKIAVNLCINRDGRVTLVRWDRENSTIRDTDAVRKTLAATQRYRFERDYSVPARQCGKITFIIDKNGN
ncbi:MAG: hypothetical protein D6765_07255, partial [Bacteroidetes bacterium]